MSFEDYIDAGGLGGYETSGGEDYIDFGGLSGYFPTSASEDYIDRGFLGTGGDTGTTSLPTGITDAAKNIFRQLTGQQSSGLQGYLQTNAGNLTGLLALYALMGGNKPKMAGYAGSIPKLRASRQQVAQPEGRRRMDGRKGRDAVELVLQGQRRALRQRLAAGPPVGDHAR